MKQIIKFIDENIDGCGTNVESLVQITGAKPLTRELLSDLNCVISNYKADNEFWDTDEILGASCEFLENRGYQCDCLCEDFTITF